MVLPYRIENLFLQMANFFFDRRLQPIPAMNKLQQCKIIAHRGEQNSINATENTLAAFEKAARANIWGIELDVRWTHDLIPVVTHDADTRRLHGRPISIASTPLKDLNSRIPSIPTLSEVVARFGRRLHLMIEIKQQPWINLQRQSCILAEVLHPLQPVKDYHLLSLTPQTLMDLPQTPLGAKVPIAYYLPDRFSQLAIRHQWGGLCGHYLFMRRAIIARHKRQGQQIGTGFADSANTLLRELHRGVDWIFSNKAQQMQALINKWASVKESL